MKRFVLDCSIAAAWFFEDEFNDYTEVVREFMLGEGAVAVVPAIWTAEVSNVLYQSERRKRITPEKVNQALHVLSQLPIETDYLPVGSMGHVLRLCREHTLTSYDALYLELALRESTPLATQDKKLRESAKASGVELV